MYKKWESFPAMTHSYGKLTLSLSPCPSPFLSVIIMVHTNLKIAYITQKYF